MFVYVRVMTGSWWGQGHDRVMVRLGSWWGQGHGRVMVRLGSWPGHGHGRVMVRSGSWPGHGEVRVTSNTGCVQYEKDCDNKIILHIYKLPAHNGCVIYVNAVVYKCGLSWFMWFIGSPHSTLSGCLLWWQVCLHVVSDLFTFGDRFVYRWWQIVDTSDYGSYRALVVVSLLPVCTHITHISHTYTQTSQC